MVSLQQMEAFGLNARFATLESTFTERFETRMREFTTKIGEDMEGANVRFDARLQADQKLVSEEIESRLTRLSQGSSEGQGSNLLQIGARIDQLMSLHQAAIESTQAKVADIDGAMNRVNYKKIKPILFICS